MQRIVCRYRRDNSINTNNQQDLRSILIEAVMQAGLPLSEGRRGLVLGPPLPSGATSEDERCVLELLAPWEPSEVRVALNLRLPAGVDILQTWIAIPGSPDEHPEKFDITIYDVLWRDAPPAGDFLTRVRQFFLAPDVIFTRVREHKTQQLNARLLVREIQVLTRLEDQARIRMTLVIGPQGNLRPEEVFAVLGFHPEPGTLAVHRVALLQSGWLHPSSGKPGTDQWRRQARKF